ncbi:MAG: DNA repair protein RadC [Thermodesulfobacteriota bacterium]|nr:DNA repair protein RadC [Thermodesulfobacteriota bacterium]
MKESNKNHGIKSWPRSERPRELLLEQGPEYVSDAGLVAILLRTGIKGKDAVTLGRELLKQFGGLGGLLNANKRDLKKIKGLGTAKIAQLLAATEIAKRQLKEEVVGKKVINGPEDVIEYLSLSMANLKDEVFKVLYLDSAHVVLSAEVLFKGTVDQSAVYPREIIKRAFELNATSLIFVHNHPSGNLKPSQHDLSLNRKLAKACLAVDLTPLDHFIISPRGYLSLKNEGMFADCLKV